MIITRNNIKYMPVVMIKYLLKIRFFLKGNIIWDKANTGKKQLKKRPFTSEAVIPKWIK